jgi:hypothetical protein
MATIAHKYFFCCAQATGLVLARTTLSGLDPGDEPGAIPQFYVVAVHHPLGFHPLGFLNGLLIVGARNDGGRDQDTAAAGRALCKLDIRARRALDLRREHYRTLSHRRQMVVAGGWS